MSLITAAAPAFAPIANQNLPNPPAQIRGSEVSSHSQTVLASQSPALAMLSTESRSRGVSTGDGKKVDASFEKQDSKAASKEDSSRGGKTRTARTLDVEA